MSDNSVLKGIICYYSGSGNTRLACQYIQSNIKNVKFDLFNIARSGIPDLGVYDVVGFVAGLEESFSLVKQGKEVGRKKAAGLLTGLWPSLSRTHSKRDMGIKYVDEPLCDECRICEKLCSCVAVKLDPKPVFDINATAAGAATTTALIGLYTPASTVEWGITPSLFSN
ncbi:MAG: hypothetical protein NT082_03100 [Chloroflexi bacterium]|nr:hypothetical protein [Chloroflexota bacterium]